ncbi:MAG: Ubiquinone biosynthesis O-methyltransferase [Candidatus Anoxychlamydiales bacterium]|nr:Ubiquinone biosynthesis O-methyltransferase [Candidatus Anoxychlamydiales bacterium]
MKEEIFKSYPTLLTNNQTSKNISNYDEKYFKTFYLNKLPKDKNAKILDLGCGSGKYLKILNKLGYKNTFGIDISIEQIKVAKKSNIFNVECIDALKFLKNTKEKYDTILLIDVLEHIELGSSFDLINLIYNSLNTHGQFFIQVPNALAPFSPLRYSDITHNRAYTTFSLRQTLNYSNFKNFKFYELAPFSHGIKSFIRNILWHTAIKPCLKAFMLTSYGTSFEKIYTANFLCECKK